MHVLRAEKGFVIVGQDTDGSVTPVDLHMQWLLSANKDFIGNRSLQRADCIRKDRKQLVGLVPEDGSTVVPEGTQLVDEMPDPRPPTPVPMIGHVTSSYASACLGHPVALALLVNGGARHGDVVTAACSNGDVVPVRVTGPVFYDPKNARQRQDD
jgi:sarcosine oxidase subunit alpha